jgi:hypothetical protein
LHCGFSNSEANIRVVKLKIIFILLWPGFCAASGICRLVSANLFHFVDGEWDAPRRAAELEVLYNFQKLVVGWELLDVEISQRKVSVNRFSNEGIEFPFLIHNETLRGLMAAHARECVAEEIKRARVVYPGNFIFDLFADIPRDPNVLLAATGRRMLAAALRAAVGVQSKIVLMERFLSEEPRGKFENYLNSARVRGEIPEYPELSSNFFAVKILARQLFSNVGPQGDGAVPPGFRRILKRSWYLTERLQIPYDVPFANLVNAVNEFTYGKHAVELK